MSRPSDGMTLEELREEYDWLYEFQSYIAERISGDPDVHNHADYVNRLEAENAELRDELDFCLKHVPNCDECEAMLDCDECLRANSSQKERKRLDYENGQLRELVSDLAICACGKYCYGCPHQYDGCDRDERIRELGVEV